MKIFRKETREVQTITDEYVGIQKEPEWYNVETIEWDELFYEVVDWKLQKIAIQENETKKF